MSTKLDSKTNLFNQDSSFWKCPRCGKNFKGKQKFDGHLNTNNCNPDYLLDNVSYLTKKTNLFISNFRLTLTDSNGISSSGNPNPVKRETVQAFSHASATRMKMFLSQIDLQFYRTRLFFTCTFHNTYPLDKDGLKRYLQSLLKRIEYHLPSASIVWRIELQKREAPHFHFLIFFPGKLDLVTKNKIASTLKNQWGILTKQINYFAFNVASDVREMNSNLKLFHYLAKYSAKQSDKEIPRVYGRLWGYRNEFALREETPIAVTKEFFLALKQIILEDCKKYFEPTDEFLFNFNMGKKVNLFISPSKIKKFLSMAYTRSKQKPPG